MINYKNLNPLKRLFYGLKARSKIITDKARFFQMSRLQYLCDKQTQQYDRQQSYRFCWFDLQHQSTLAEWDNVTDVINGGESKAEVWFDEKEKCVEYEGYVEAKDKDRMIYYPFINLMRTHPSYVTLGPMRLLQVEAKTDGKPLEVHFTLKSFIKGQINIYGFLLSKSTDWHTYEIPIENMILRGTQQDYHQGAKNVDHTTNNYFSKPNHSSIFDKEHESLKKVIRTQIFGQNSMQLSNIGFRLVSTQSEDRHIRIRRISFAYKKGYQKFVSSYKSPYLYITDDQVTGRENIGGSMGEVEFLGSDLENVELIDTGNVKYYRNDRKDGESNSSRRNRRE